MTEDQLIEQDLACRDFSEDINKQIIEDAADGKANYAFSTDLLDCAVEVLIQLKEYEAKRATIEDVLYACAEASRCCTLIAVTGEEMYGFPGCVE